MNDYHEKIVDAIIYLMYGDQPGARDGNTYCLCFTAVWYGMHNASDICIIQVHTRKIMWVWYGHF